MSLKINVVRIVLERNYDIEINDEAIYGIEQAGRIFIDEIGSCNVEYVGIICLDATNRMINYANVTVGDINSVRVNLAELFKFALLSNASKIIVAHNHPSGILEITNSDIAMTKNIGAISKMFNIELVDSLIVGNGDQIISIRKKIAEGEV